MPLIILHRAPPPVIVVEPGPAPIPQEEVIMQTPVQTWIVRDQYFYDYSEAYAYAGSVGVVLGPAMMMRPIPRFYRGYWYRHNHRDWRRHRR